MGVDCEVNKSVNFGSIWCVWVCFGFNESDISVIGALRTSEVVVAVSIKWSCTPH